MGRRTRGGGVARSRGETGHSCWDGKWMWSGREKPGSRPDDGAGCLPAHPTGGEAVPVPPRSPQPRTEPCPLPGLAQRRAQPAAVAGVRKALQSRQQLGPAGCPCAFLPAGSARDRLCSPSGAALTRPEIRTHCAVRGAGARPMRGSAASALARTRGAAAPGRAVSDTENAPHLRISRSAAARDRSRAARGPGRSQRAPRPRSAPGPAQLPRRLCRRPNACDRAEAGWSSSSEGFKDILTSNSITSY